MRVRNRDGVQPSERRDDLDRGVVEQRDAIPEHVAGWCLEQQRPLPNAEGRRGADPQQLRFEALEGVAVALRQLRKGGPALTGAGYVLALVVTDRTRRRRRRGRRILRAAGGAHERRVGEGHDRRVWKGAGCGAASHIGATIVFFHRALGTLAPASDPRSPFRHSRLRRSDEHPDFPDAG